MTPFFLNAFELLEQGQDVLSGRVRGRQHRGAGLVEDLSSSELRGLGGEVRIADLRLAGRDVLESDLQAPGVGLEGVAFERPQTTPHHRDLGDAKPQTLHSHLNPKFEAHNADTETLNPEPATPYTDTKP